MTEPDALTLYGDGIHDDSDALQAVLDGHPVLNLSSARIVGRSIMGGVFLISKALRFSPTNGASRFRQNSTVSDERRRYVSSYSPAAAKDKR